MISKSYILATTENSSNLIDAVNDVCLQLNWIEGTTFGYAGEEIDDETQYFFWLQASGAPGRMRLVVDAEMPAQYVEVAVTTEYLHEQVHMLLERALTIVDDIGLKLAVCRAADGDPGALMRLGVGYHGGFDPEVKTLIEAGLTSRNTAIRRGAAMAIFLLGWPEFAPALDTAISAETDEKLRAQLKFTGDTIH